MADTFGIRHLADNPQLYEPARSNNFEFIVTDLTNLVKPGVSEDLTSEERFIQNGQEILRVSVLETSVPHFELSSIEVQRGNAKIKFAGTPTFNDGTLIVNDYIGARTKDILLAWQAKAYDVKSEAVQLASNYKKLGWLLEYTPDYSQVIRAWKLYGCWVKTLSEDNFSNETNNKRTVNASISYDWAVPVDPSEVA